MAGSDSGPRLLLVGIDAGCFEVMGPLASAGAIPTLERLFRGGTAAPLESQIPPWTASAWPSLYTGKNPGKHGVFDFVTFDGYDWDVVNATCVRERPVWELLADAGYRSVVVNVPVTHPPRSFDGALIPGMTAPESPRCHPPGILEDVETACGEYRVYPQTSAGPAPSIRHYEETIEARGGAFRYLCDRFDPDFAFVQFQVTDSVFHERPGDREAIEAVYRAVDAEVAATIDALEPRNVLVASDHGIGPVPGPEVRVNEHLRDGGYCSVTRGGEGMPNWTRAWERDLLEGESAADRTPGPLERSVALAARAGITTQRVAAVLDRVGLKETVGRHVPTDVRSVGSEQVDFPASDAYVRSKSELGVRINLAGREPEGTVSQSSYESLRDELIASLEDLETPGGRPAFEAVLPREGVFSGPEIDAGPDIVTVPRGFDTAITAGVGGGVFGEPMEPWNHTREGFLAARGADIDERVTLETPSLFDVAPTICSLFDLPVDESMDGQTLAFVESSELGSYPDYEPATPTTTTDGSVEDRLSDLGYL